MTGSHEVSGSIPLISTKKKADAFASVLFFLMECGSEPQVLTFVKAVAISPICSYKRMTKQNHTNKTEEQAMKNELNERELMQVSGGSGRDSQVAINIELPADLGDVTIKVYVDGEIDMSKTITVDTNYITHRLFTFVGRGVSQVRFKINNEPYCTYEINFDAGTATRLN